MIQVDRITYNYEDREDALHEVTFAVATGERVGIIGPNGAGKTTLFHIICGILKPSSGSVTVSGSPVKPHAFNPDVGYLFQNPDDQLFSPTVYDDIAFGPVNLGLDKDEVRKKAAGAMDITGTGNFADRPPHHLSGGEKRMAAVAAVISMEPPVIIYDEPSSNLDMRTRRKLITLINGRGETVLIASHDLELVLETCRRVILIDNGRVVADGLADEIMDNADLMAEHGLERPHSLLHGRGHVHP